MPMRRELYPKDWPAISARIRARAGGLCEWCTAPDRKLIIRDEHGDGFEVHEPCGGCAGGDDRCRRAVRVILTVAHLDHNPKNNADENLAALCQRCHNRYDVKHRMANAAETRRRRLEERTGQTNLLPEAE